MARTPDQLLKSHRHLKRLVHSTRHLNQLQAQLDQQLPPAARPHCRIASWQQGTLLLVVDQAGWATRMRYQEPRLKQALSRSPEFRDLRRIVFKVRPGTTHQEHDPAAILQRQLSASAASDLRETASTLSDDRLRSALERLARRATRSHDHE